MNISLDINRQSTGEATSSITIAPSTDLTPRSIAKTISSDLYGRHGEVVPYVYSDYQKWERKKTSTTSSHKNPLSRQFSRTKHMCCHATSVEQSMERPPMWCGARNPGPVLPRVKYRSLKHQPPVIAMLKVSYSIVGSSFTCNDSRPFAGSD